MNNIEKILRCKNSIRQVTLRSPRRFTVNSVQTEAPTLKENQITDAAPFEDTGIDLAGLFIYQRSEKVLYTCAVYRAVHHEL